MSLQVTDPIAIHQHPLDALPRRLGRVDGPRPGPTVVAITGVHGNEPAGVFAAQRVLARLAADGGLAAGTFVALVGHRAALSEGRRFIAADLNRAWLPERIAAVRSGRRDGPEDTELAELIAALDDICRHAPGEIIVLDLHTTSAPSSAFALFADTLANRAFARRFPLPLVLGLEERVDGTILSYLGDLGFVTVGVEGGQHADPRSVERMEAFLCAALDAAGLVPAGRLIDVERCWRILREASAKLPRYLEVRYRHPIEQDDGFTMRPGFTNLETVRTGQPLGADRRGPVCAPEDGRLLMPLYQTQGDDGFFIAREVWGFWIALSGIVRRLRLSGLLRFLPGVAPDPLLEDGLRIDTRIARAYPLEIFHLFGYRLHRREDGQIVVRRRREAARSSASLP